MAGKSELFHRSASLEAEGAWSLCRLPVHTTLLCAGRQCLSLLCEQCSAGPSHPWVHRGCQGRPSENVAFCSTQISCPGF